jgi:hypothetical protein
MVASKVVDLAKWRLVFSSNFSKMEGKTLQNGGFFLEKLSIQYCCMIKDYNKFCKYAQKGHLDYTNHFHVDFAVINLKKILRNLQKNFLDYSRLKPRKWRFLQMEGGLPD